MNGAHQGNLGTAEKFRKYYEQMNRDERELILSIDVKRLNIWIMLSASLIVSLFFLDIVTTLVAMSTRPGFVERNMIAATLFERGFQGFLAALALKYYPLLPVAVVTCLKPQGNRFDLGIRMVKVGVLVGLIAGNVLYVFITINNLLHLLR
ncbi:MAG: hypothetical protein HYU39_08770 [Thaumarchaeota archaeon]|nr:hypothetical protein [Nitrososphaerota archaeon]